MTNKDIVLGKIRTIVIRHSKSTKLNRKTRTITLTFQSMLSII
ncbi:hypothetical protein HMPREF9103_03187 [Lentilactobacillus parafarraginis F0439]|uniref:Uncharacterized protein n=1 Tax=Lentilactobacillus parafarraginis F0439 TaxID=797515 RepID=G9ZTV2_9LACO|nr:hypothetical protein HMPREF9103_03187 [Lentilactobacillus parafarraginis F0439]